VQFDKRPHHSVFVATVTVSMVSTASMGFPF